MVKRFQYVAYTESEICESAIKSDLRDITRRIKNGECLTVAAYKHKNAIFLYFEALSDGLNPEALLPSITECLAPTPYATEYLKWKPLANVYYTNNPLTPESLSREGKKTRIGKIAYLHREKLPSYVYYHKALVDEGLYSGDKYLYISLIDNLLFAYCEEPRISTHIKSDVDLPSQVIKEWEKQNPRSHFDRTKTDGENNFLILEPIFTVGKEDI